jgi:plasmid stability protein
MRSACVNVQRMGMIQIRNVPEDIHRKLKVRAAERGQSLSDYLLEIVRVEAEQLTLEEVFERIKSREPVDIPISSAEIIRELREEMG